MMTDFWPHAVLLAAINQLIFNSGLFGLWPCTFQSCGKRHSREIVNEVGPY